jgi:hypothetical protein
LHPHSGLVVDGRLLCGHKQFVRPGVNVYWHFLLCTTHSCRYCA